MTSNIALTGFLFNSPTNPSSNIRPSTSGSPRNDNTIPIKRRWTRKCCTIKDVETEEQKMVQKLNGLDSGFTRLTKYGDVVPVPWNDPAPSELFHHLSARSERSCLDHHDEPVFTSFSGRFSLEQHQPLKIDMGLPLPQEKLCPAQKRYVAHQKLEGEERLARKILPPPARPPRLPVAIAEGMTGGNDDDNNDEVNVQDDYFDNDEDREDDDDDDDDEVFEEYYSTGTLSNMPPSTRNDYQEFSPYNKKILTSLVNHTLERKNQHEISMAQNASPSVRRRSQHDAKLVENEVLEEKQLLSETPTREKNTNLKRKQFTTTTEMLIKNNHTFSAPRVSHSPRTLKQFMSPPKTEILIKLNGFSPAKSTRSRQENEGSRRSPHSDEEHQQNDQYNSSYFLPSPPRSQAPMHVSDLMNILSARPKSAAVVSSVASPSASMNTGVRSNGAVVSPSMIQTMIEKSPELRKRLATSTKEARTDSQLNGGGTVAASPMLRQQESGEYRSPADDQNNNTARSLQLAATSNSVATLERVGGSSSGGSFRKINNNSAAPSSRPISATNQFTSNVSPRKRSASSAFVTPPRSIGSCVFRGSLKEQQELHQEYIQQNKKAAAVAAAGAGLQLGGSHYLHPYSSFNQQHQNSASNTINTPTSLPRVGSARNFPSGVFGKSVRIVE